MYAKEGTPGNVLVVYRDEVERAIFSVDMRDKFRDLTLELGRV